MHVKNLLDTKFENRPPAIICYSAWFCCFFSLNYDPLKIDQGQDDGYFITVIILYLKTIL